jgi:hypothetical protein
MDDSRFDSLARTVTHARSRRAVLGTLLAGTLGLHGRADTTARKRCAPCKTRKHGRCKATKQLNGTACLSGRGTCQDGRCRQVSSEEQPPTVDPPATCPTGDCSRSRPCGSDCACLDIGGGTRRCLAVGPCAGVGACERGTCGSGCTCVNPGGAKTGCASTVGCPPVHCTSDTDCGSDCICVGIGNAARCVSRVRSS